MEANETITPVLAGMYNAIQVQEMLANQAEISFKAGHEQFKGDVISKLRQPNNMGILSWQREAYMAGIKDVVEFMKTYGDITKCDPDTMSYFSDYIWVDLNEWQAKLKEWGVNND